MRLLDTIRTGVSSLKGRVEIVEEDFKEVVGLARHRVKEQVGFAMARTGKSPREVRLNPVDFGDGILVRQKDENTLCVGAKELSREALGSLAVTEHQHSLSQNDLNSYFLPFGWSCRLGNGENSLSVFAYEGRNGGPEHGNRILVVKNAQGEVVRMINPTVEL